MKTFALLVGVSRFKYELGNLEYVEHDVNEMFQVLHQYFGLPEQNIIRLIDSEVTTQSVSEAANQIIQNASVGDRVILYFATHGKTVYETPWLATYEAGEQGNDIAHGWINTGELLGKFHRAQCNVLGFLDSCQSTMFLARGVINRQQVEVYCPDQYSVVFAAAGVHEEALPDIEFQHGCWTYYLLTALKGRAPQAFAFGTNRITVNSLQDYLLQKVSYRVETIFGKRQTPHVWGTRAEDVIINEYNSQEIKNLKINEIYFGEIDADSEKSSSPSPEFLKNNFYDLNSICETLSDENAIQIIIGNKGTGKTFIGEYLGSNFPNMIYRSVGAIGLSDIKNVSFAQGNQKGRYCDAWKYAIYTILACCIVKEERIGHHELKNLLHHMYGEQYLLLLADPVKRRSIMFRKQLKNGFRLPDEYCAYRGENGLVPISNLIMMYEDLFNQHYEAGKMYFLVDGLDEQLRGNMQSEQKAFLLDLLDMMQSSNEALSNIRLVLMFRNDILKTLNDEANLNKMITARSCLLSWLPPDGGTKNAPLYQFLEKRVSTYSQYKTGATLTLDQILPPKVNGRETWDWVMALTTYTPRDVIAFFNACKAPAGENTYINEDTLWAATRPYSEYLWREMTDVMNGTCLSGMSDELVNVFSKITQEHNTDTQTSFSFNDFRTAYNANEKLSTIPISASMKILYETGVMGIHPKPGKTYWYFRENPIAYDQDLWRESTFDLHKGLWKKMHIW